MSKQITVSPAGDGLDMRGNWLVRVNGTAKSGHVKKSAAKRKARKTASPGDTITIRRTDGTIQSSTTYRGGSSSSNSSSGNSGPFPFGEMLGPFER